MVDEKVKRKWMVINECVNDRPLVQEYNCHTELPPIPISFPVKGSIGETGDWRTFRPVIVREKCTNCGRCFIFCPEGSIQDNAEGKLEIDLVYCKGCGICANECKVGALEMVRESELKEAEKNGE